MTPKQTAIEEMVLVGSQMANLCFNISRSPERAAASRETMESLRLQWDSALGQYRKLTSKRKAQA